MCCRFLPCFCLPNFPPQKKGYLLGCPRKSVYKWFGSMGYNLLINRVYWGYNPLILTSNGTSKYSRWPFAAVEGSNLWTLPPFRTSRRQGLMMSILGLLAITWDVAPLFSTKGWWRILLETAKWKLPYEKEVCLGFGWQGWVCFLCVHRLLRA